MRAVVTAILLALTGCGSESKDLSENYANSAEERGGETYDEFDERRDSPGNERGSVGGYGCTSDCSGHNAGYAWAEEKGITNPDHCGGKSWSFIEGCQAYAEEHAQEEE